jgi:hypothetical protein
MEQTNFVTLMEHNLVQIINIKRKTNQQAFLGYVQYCVENTTAGRVVESVLSIYITLKNSVTVRKLLLL